MLQSSSSDVINNFEILELSAITYNVMFLMTLQELSVRDYSVYAFNKILQTLESKIKEMIEKQ